MVLGWYGPGIMPELPAPWGIQLHTASATPVYLQVAHGLEARIRAGELPAGSALPAERDLASRLGVSRVTVRQALSRLAEQGLLERRHGSGTFVAPAGPSSPDTRTLGLLESFSEDIRARGQRPGARVLHFEQARPSPAEAMALALAPRQTVYRLRRLRTADTEPLAVEESTLPASRVGPLTAADVTDASLYALLSRQGLTPHRAIRHLRAVNATPELAAALGVPEGSALIATERVSWTRDGQPIEFARAHYRGDRYDFVMELHAEDMQA